MYALAHIRGMKKPELLVKKNLDWLIEQKGTNPHELQRVTGVPQPTIHRILTGESTDPRTTTLQPLADYFQVSVADLRDRDLAVLEEGLAGLPSGSYMRVATAESDESQFLQIPKVKLRLSAGIMGFQTEPDTFDGTTVSISPEWVLRHGYRADQLIAIRIKGESMETTLYDNDLVIINLADKHLVDGSVYAFNYEGEAVVKRAIREGGQWYLGSDNPAPRFGRRVCRNGDCNVIGKVVKREGDRL